MNGVIHKNRLEHNKKGKIKEHKNINKYPQKMSKKKKLRKKHKIKIDIALYLFLILISFLFIASAFTLFFKIENIYVTGNCKYDSQGIINLSDINIGSNLLLCDKSKAREKIYNNLPCVDSVDIRKKLPASIEINIKMADKSFAINLQDQFFVIGSNQRILEKVEDKPENILIIKGIELLSYNEGEYIQYKDREIKSILDKITEAVDSNNFIGVTLIDISNLNKIDITYENRVDINIGNIDDIDYKILTSKEILENKITKLEKGLLNVSSIKCDNKSYFTPVYVKN